MAGIVFAENKILYEDNHVLAVVKPVNMPCCEDSSKDYDLLNALKDYIKEKYNKPGAVYLGLVHRLDRPTGGCMIFAKTSKAASRLSKYIQSNQMQKEYLAVTKNVPVSGTYEDYLYKDGEKNMVYVSDKANKKAKIALLQTKTVATNGTNSLACANLITGRSHQIRVQFASRGNALWGDNKYGDGKPGQQLALWSHKIKIKHPTHDEILELVSLPDINKFPWNLFRNEIENLK